jgi:alpha-mannosidase
MLCGMKFTELLILLPCHSLEDFPTHHRGEAAEGLLAAWTALWHPALIAVAQKTPNWARADDPPTPNPGAIFVVPTVAELDLPADFKDRATSAGAALVSGLVRRNDLIGKILETLGDDAPSIADHSLINDFFALGLAFLLTELLTRRMRYMSRIDETSFQEKVVAAATAGANDNLDAARDALKRAFELLMEARAHFYPVDTNLLDFTLVAETTIGQSLRDELARDTPANLFASGEALEQMAAREPLSLTALKTAIADGRASIVAGEHAELELPLFPPESILALLRRGRETYVHHLQTAPRVFARRRYGLTPALPQLLRGLGYQAALHFTLDDGRFPQAERSKTSWEGAGYSTIDTIARVPLDARDAGSILQLPEKLGESMDYDYVSMTSFVHWPGHSSIFYDDFRRIPQFAPVFGKFVTANDFFSNTESAGQFSRFEPDQYRSPYLVQSVTAGCPNYLSSYVRRNVLRHQISSAESFSTWAAMLTGAAYAFDQSLAAQIELAETPDDTTIAKLHANAASTLATAIADNPSPSDLGRLIFNPAGFSRRFIVPLLLESPPAVAGPIQALDETNGNARALVEVPAFGFAWIGPTGETNSTKSPRKLKSSRAIADGNALTNEDIEVTIHPETGGIQSIRDRTSRGNRLSQQLAMRLPHRPLPIDVDQAIAATGHDRRYTRMLANMIEVTDAGRVRGEITSRGRLIDGDRTVAEFTQKTRLIAGSRIIEIDIELAPFDEPLADPLHSYYACRWAWPEDFSELRRSVHQASYSTNLNRFEAPDFVEIVGTKTRTTVLPAGLPFHIRSGDRTLDTLLVVRGESARHFSLGIAVEHPRPWHAACDFTLPACVLSDLHPPPRGAHSGWLFHLDATNVVVTHWSPLIESGNVVGFRTRLLELGGHGVSAHLRCFRTVASARRIDFLGEQIEQLSVEADRIRIDLGSHEFVEIEARW